MKEKLGITWRRRAKRFVEIRTRNETEKGSDNLLNLIGIYGFFIRFEYLQIELVDVNHR